ncbi:hypothetical protein JKL49_12215 [Phenylobacterium sp. 20VBR1]|uniref:TonB-dependent receptor plug domain-containing protein n=1 Tax=Phenylobacterium glaciei TaxID=2803784 RepID=A0A941D234_9CAUL|nr:hypothetical protein [Phenylobacterium glaciei]MBR7620152.1 hypothetical protein [Phenylobacterium glaciei]
MTRARFWMVGAAVAVLAGANGAWADEAVATASATPAPAADTSTAAQIDQFIKSAPTPTLEQDGVDGITPGERKMHGEVSVSVGTGGYRSFSALSVIPIGETGTLAIAVSQSRNSPYANYGEYGGYGGYGRGYGEGERQSIGLAFSSQGDAPRCSKRMDRGPAWRRLDDGPGERACSNDAMDLAR